MEDKELENNFNVSLEEIKRRAAPYETGEWPEGKTTLMGRPLRFNERMRSVTYRDTEHDISLMDERAATLGLSRSDYIRNLIRNDLANA